MGDDSPTAGRDQTLTWQTADAYQDAAGQLMLTSDLPAWSPELRSRTRLAELCKRHLVDPSLAASLLGSGAEGLLKNPHTLGCLFESLVARDLLIYAQTLDASVYHYRERNGDLEVDIVIERRDGTWIGVEVKLGHDIDGAAASLRRVAERRIAREPAALVLITAGEYAYRRPDNVDVVPLGALKP